MSPVIFSKSSLDRRSRGEQKDIAYVLGVVCDVDADHGQDPDSISHLRPLPTVAIITSTAAEANSQGHYFFNEPLTAPRARQIAAGLAKAVGDKVSNASDPSHIWRVPGTLYHFTEDKAKRRGLAWPVAPQVVTVNSDLCRYQLVDASELVDFLALEAEAENERDEVSHDPRDPEGRWQVGRDIWNGDERELTRLIDAIKHLDKVDHANRSGGQTIECKGINYDIRTRATWLLVGMALHIYFRASERGFDLWRSTSAGDADLGFTGAPDRWDERDSRERWVSFASPEDGKNCRTVATLFMLANFFGFDSKRRRYGLGALPRSVTLVSQRGQIVAEAGRTYHALSIVTEPSGRDLRNEAKDAHRRLAQRCRASRHELAVLQLISDDLHGQDDGNGPVGVAYRSAQSYCAELSDTFSVQWDHRDLWRAVHGLVRLGLLVASSGNQVGAHGRKGASYALTVPNGMTWHGVIEDRRQRLSHNEKTAKKGLKGGHGTSHETGQKTGCQGGSSKVSDSPTFRHPPGSSKVSVAETYTNLKEYHSERGGQEAWGVSHWLASSVLPPAMAEELREAVIETRSQTPYLLVAKFSRVLAAGVSPEALARGLGQVHEVMSRLPLDTPKDKRLRRLFDEVCLMVAGLGVDVPDAEAVHRQRAERKAKFERWRGRGVDEPRAARDERGYQAAKDGEWVPPAPGARKPPVH